MKKKLIGGLCLMATLAFMSLGSVHALSPETDVTGVITNAGGPVAGAVVKVKCGSLTRTDVTNSTGTYLVSFPPSKCPPGSTVMVMAHKASQSGGSTGTVIGLTTKLNIGLINVVIPEFGAIAGLLAVSAGIGAVYYSRRRALSQAGL